MALISAAERDIVTGMRRVTDARMNLASALLKRAFVSNALGITWRDVRIGRRGDEKHGKPCAVDSSSKPISRIDFNISHSGGLVALIGYCSRLDPSVEAATNDKSEPTTKLIPDILVGVDVVCVTEQNHVQSIYVEGFESWIDMFEDVFTPSELWIMKYEIDWLSLEDGSILTLDDIGCLERCVDCGEDIRHVTPSGRQINFSSDRIIEAKLRRFLALWCYKEAYIKVSGEALLASWLKQLSFDAVQSPKPTKEGWGEEIDDIQIYLRGQPVSDVKMKIHAFEEDFMLSTAVQGNVEHMDLPAFKMLDLENDVISIAKY